MKKGQSIIEIIVGLGIFTLAIAAFAILSSQAKNLSQNNLQQMQATNFVQGGMESVRNIRDSNLQAGKPFDDGMTVGDKKVITNLDNSFALVDSTQAGSPVPEQLGDFNRYIKIEKQDSGETLKVTVTVKWGNNYNNSFEAIDLLTNWKS